MLLRILKYNTTAGYLLIPLLATAAWLPSLLSGSFVEIYFDLQPMPLYGLLTGVIPDNSVTATIIALLLLISTGFYLIRLSNKYLFLQERTLLPVFFFIFIVSSIPELHRLHPALVSMIFFLPATDRLLDSYRTERLSYSIFEAAFLLGMGSLVYFNILWFIILVWAALLILRPVIWREWVFSIMGILLPWVFFMATDYFMHDSFEWSFGLISGYLLPEASGSYLSLTDRVWLGFMLLLILFASRHMINSIQAMKVFSRKIFRLFFWAFAIGVAAFFVSASVSIEMFVIASVPVAFLLSHYILAKRKGFWANAILWMTIAFMLLLTSVLPKVV